MRYSFFFHYNKPLTQQRGVPTVSVHFRGKCHFVDNVIVRVATAGRIRKTSPRFVIAGKATSVDIRDGVAVIE